MFTIQYGINMYGLRICYFRIQKNAGMNEHILKPLDIGKVKATIAGYVERKG